MPVRHCTATDMDCLNPPYRAGLCHPHHELARLARERDAKQRRKAGREYGPAERAGMVKRNLAAMVYLHDTGQGVALVELVELETRMHEAVQRTVDAMRTETGGSHSWAQIGALLGVSAQGAQQRFGRRRAAATGPAPEAARKVGGQPAELR